ncbi:hypothetical protein CVD25_07345 [Bacillus canaveralius]|uniref:Uncharacterized protein n=1 Tax=Bacillus canaveralius TaxID=1403243 RepID=A0A2N5GRX9_9BACI|nr:hypothetical protein CU635_01500 [Bacillus canaveralius]PLR98537.1 hypothetical protein CVD25_07345 [Bacillus canaveralius]
MSVMKGKKEFSPKLIFGSVRTDNPLTHCEREILKMVAEGKKAKEISSYFYHPELYIRNFK